MIRTTLVSHACLLIQAKNLNIMTDPVFFDPHWEDINVMCPKREIDFAKFPKVDVLYLSHRHQDHFDVRTLAFLKRSDILVPDFELISPKDPILLEVLSALEYPLPRVAADFETFRIGDVFFTPTPSLIEADFPEHGLIIHDGEVTVWNQVDTVVSPPIIQYMKKHHPPIDLMHARFLPLLEGNFTHHQAIKLPYEEYSSFMKVVKAVGPRFIVPGSAGFRYSDDYRFLNQYSFPTSQEQYLIDMKAFCPEVERSGFFPGDVAEVRSEGVRIFPQDSDFVSTLVDDGYKIEFKPVMRVDPIKNRVDDPTEVEKIKTEVVSFIENKMLDRLMDCKISEVWRHWCAVYQLEVFGQSESDIWTFDFGGEPKVVKGRTGKINVYEGIGLVEFYEFLNGKSNWDFVGGSAQYRTFHNVYRVDNGFFESYPQEKKFPQPLMELFPEEHAMNLEKFMKEVRRWKNTE